MSKLKVKEVILGDNADLSKNFVLSVPAVADGTLTIKRGDGTNVLSIDAQGRVLLSASPSFTDGTNGRAARIGDFGLGSINSSYLGSGIDFNAIPKRSGWYSTYAPSANAPNGDTSNIWCIEVICYSGDWVIQRATSPNQEKLMYQRSFYNGNTWSGWAAI